MFGASVSELYLLTKLLINIEREVARSMSDHKKGNAHTYTGTVSQAWLDNVQACYTQAGPAHAAGHGDGMDR